MTPNTITTQVEDERARRIAMWEVREEVNMTPTKITAMVEGERERQIALYQERITKEQEIAAKLQIDFEEATKGL